MKEVAVKSIPEFDDYLIHKDGKIFSLLRSKYEEYGDMYVKCF